MAGLHLAFAFPMIRRLLLLFNLNNVGLFALTTVISFVMFGVLYALIYRLPGNVYYRIVSDTTTGMRPSLYKESPDGRHCCPATGFLLY